MFYSFINYNYKIAAIFKKLYTAKDKYVLFKYTSQLYKVTIYLISFKK